MNTPSPQAAMFTPSASPTRRSQRDMPPFRDEGGLVVIVVITTRTQIVVAGSGAGRCADLSADTAVQVSGRQSGDRIVASSITVE